MLSSLSNRMKSRLVVLALLVVSLSFCGQRAFGQTGNRCLWAVSSGKNTVYLLGSIHLLSKREYPLPDDFEKAYRDSGVVVFETDLDQMDTPEIQTLVRRNSLLPRKTSIKDVLSIRTSRMLEAYLASRGLEMARFEGLRPWVCALTLTMLELHQRGFLPEYGVDRYFYRKAKSDRKKIIALEPVREQLSLFFELDNAEQDAFLKRTLSDLERVEMLFPEMLAAWKSGDVQTLDALLRESFKEHPDLYDKFLVRRNEKWLPVIAGLIGQPENVLVVVGASHLGGENGVIKMLVRKGFRVIRK